MNNSTYDTGSIEVAPGAFAFIQPGGATDAGFLIEEEGVIIIDTLMTSSLAEALLHEVRRRTSKPIQFVINTHWHGDHVFGNAMMPTVPIIAHDTCRDDLLDQWDPHRAFLRDLYPMVWDDIVGLPATPPNLTFSESLTLHLGTRPIQLKFFGRAHTQGDIAVYLPSEGVLFAGDIAFHKYVPNAKDGFPTDWARVSAKVAALEQDVIVPGHGPIGTRADLVEMHSFLEVVTSQIYQSFEKGLDEAESLKSIDLGTFKSWGRQEDRLPTLVHRTYQEIRGELR